MEIELAEIIDFCKKEDRICPMPVIWNQMWKNFSKGEQPREYIPLILSTWWGSTDRAKRERFLSLIEYCWENYPENRKSISHKIKSLRKEDWHYCSENHLDDKTAVDIEIKKFYEEESLEEIPWDD
ncbi:hypothetical protein OAW20_02160 [Gammaproteobacteria bacterium]|nr:hypothetical protein [Gammaproteobacteria bacterium]